MTTPKQNLSHKTKKVDIMVRWDSNGTAGEYDVLVDGVAKAENQRFGFGSYNTSGSDGDTGGETAVGGVERVGLYILGEGRAWFDEIYLGPDFTMGKYERKKREDVPVIVRSVGCNTRRFMCRFPQHGKIRVRRDCYARCITVERKMYRIVSSTS